MKKLLFALIAGSAIAASAAPLDFTQKEYSAKIRQSGEIASFENGVLRIFSKEPKQVGTVVILNIDDLFTRIGACGKTVEITWESQWKEITSINKPWAGIKFMLMYKKADGSMVYAGSFPNEKVQTTQDWQLFRKTLKIPAEIQNPQLVLGLQGASGEIEFRNIQITTKENR